MLQIRRFDRSFRRSTTGTSLSQTIIALVTVLVLASSALSVATAAEWHTGWSSFETGSWEPDYDLSATEDEYEEDLEVEVLGVNRTTGTIAKGTSHATPFYVYDSGVAGPTVVVVGGTHGNEVAGYKAAELIRDYWVSRGKLVVIPQANRPAVKAGTRTSSLGDLNRKFPTTKTGTAKNSLARSIFSVMRKYRPDWLIDMHEGYDFHLIKKSSVGQTVIYYPNSGASTMAKAMAAAANRTVGQRNHAFTTLKYPVKGSLARAVSIVFGTKGMIVETSRKQTLSLRIKQHQVILDEMLSRLGMR